ncbi:DUF4157 domain-containing protein [Algoriphagus halophilus]
MEPGVKESMESAFDQDFSDVRVHSDDTAHRSADAINARAYTLQNDIVLGKINTNLNLLKEENYLPMN